MSYQLGFGTRLLRGSTRAESRVSHYVRLEAAAAKGGTSASQASTPRTFKSQIVTVVSMLDVATSAGFVSFQSKDVKGAQYSLFVFCCKGHEKKALCEVRAARGARAGKQSSHIIQD